jgi:hypothetical protein
MAITISGDTPNFSAANITALTSTTGTVTTLTSTTGTVTTLTSTTLSDGTNSTATTNAIQGSAKAWVNFNPSSGSSAVIRASYNVSSVTYVGTGSYTVNFTNAFADANYSVSSCAGWGGSSPPTNSFVCSIAPSTSPTTSALAIGVYISTGSATNPNYVNVSVFR